MEVKRVLRRKDGIKYLIIPKKSEIRANKLVAIFELNEEELKTWLKKKQNP